MKKGLLLATALLLSVFAFSQAKVEFGLKGGLNLAKVNTEDAVANYENATGYHAGAYSLIKVANVGIQPELLYSTRGTEVDFNSVSQDFKQEYVYLDIPVMLKLYAVAGLNLQVGPQFGMLLSVDGKTQDANGNTVAISKDSYKNSDISAAFGAGWDAPFGLNFSARYILGLTDVNSGDEEAKNRTFQVSLGFRLFKVGK
ncbi:porin family protein [Marinoscillum furvescens]|uniref:Outer membrane protein with beta-barrel domain n=1 Tax=Marinoscillum furvescens DSM 4134 TaxID=1122208 RepID=A0A3D9L0G3_MARFU|nr:porin family protein [Marinoscillum furvescens]RED95643.1 outer membrane protein with beta-barrel domain [Marinoscillum furvescens DSM 4134]